jgi:ribosomal protein S18 acetylase RimI-like enzyme
VTPVEVQQASFGDPVHRSAIVDILDSYARDRVGGGQPLAVDVRERLVPALERHPGCLVLLAFAGERPVGIAVCFFGFSTFHARPLLNVHDLAVLPECRGIGIGRALLEGVEAHARRAGCCRLTLEVQDDNARARALYARFGFGDFMVADSPTRFLMKPLG